MSQHSGILEQIQALSNERQRLYKAKWTIRNRPEYRERLRKLDEQLAKLWHDRRVELAGPSPLALMGDPPSATPMLESESNADLLTDEEPVTYLADALSQIGVDIIREVLAELREEDDERRALPLRAVLARRNRTLEWVTNGRGGPYGRVFSREIPLNAPS